MSNNHIYQVISRHFVNTQSKKDESDLRVWINENEENKSLYEKIENHWHSADYKKTTIFKHDEVKSEIWERINGKNAIFLKTKGSNRVNEYLKYAAVILIMVCSGLVVYFQSNKEINNNIDNQLITKSNTAGRKSEIHLKDGTVINLNAESELSYHEVFSDTARMVWLEGEAFFDIAKDAARPFYVISQNVVVQALGTSFNVSGFPEQDKLIVSLTTGKVRVSEKSGEWLSQLTPQIALLPGQEVYYQKDTKTFSSIQEFEADEVLGWKDGLLSFHKANLKDIQTKLERWYGVDIQLITPSEKELNYTGQFKKQSLENVLTSMGFVNNFDFEINNKNVLLKFKNEAYE
ncbi:FecR domain-containing protein [Reichenbachiella sp. MALMAid0571]|uniref:FecR family protein n=1 Tax=Reichenbachiella sp. MALMAid0571 TaxID=3143939 RepID=UPI0032E04E85